MSEDNIAFFTELKEKSRQHGFQWLPGLSEDEISAYEQTMGFSFPTIYRDYLRCMNGTAIKDRVDWKF